MTRRFTRLAAAAALVAALALPATAVAADPSPAAPPPSVAAWQAHLAHMRTMGSNLGAHISGCVEAHGSVAGMLGPNGSMVEMMAGGMMR